MPDDGTLRDAVVTARAAIRAATAEAHERLHHMPPFSLLASAEIDRGLYAAMLTRMLGFHEPMEAAIAHGMAGMTFGLPIERLRRSHLLRDDLSALGASEAALAAHRCLPEPTFLATPAHAMGALYVIEGSTLGGRQLARRLDHLLPPDTSAGRSFLMAGVDRKRPSWAQVCEALELCGADPGRRAAMIDAANITFEQFAGWFEALPHAA